MEIEGRADADEMRRRIESIRKELWKYLADGHGTSAERIRLSEAALSSLALQVETISDGLVAADLARRLSRTKDDLQRCKVLLTKTAARSVDSVVDFGSGRSTSDEYAEIAEIYAAKARARSRGHQPALSAIPDSSRLESDEWAFKGSPISAQVEDGSARCLAAYKANPSLVEEHANIERDAAEGGYGKRQVYELIQNGADALVGTPGGRIAIVLTPAALYCANEGQAIDVEGVDALLGSHLSRKRGKEIGRWGLGFKSVLGVTQRAELFSRSGSFAFDAARSADRIAEVLGELEKTPILRLAESLDPLLAAESDAVLTELMEWATTVVRLPLSEDRPWLEADLAEFPAEFLLFSSHVGLLSLDNRRNRLTRSISLEREPGGVVRLAEGSSASSWRVFTRTYRPSEAAIKDGGDLMAREEIPIAWAVPTKGRPGRGRFWAFFPTKDEMLLSGILNAPWKTHSDRHNLLEGLYNTELLRSAVAQLVVENLGDLVSPEDPARVLDYLPGRKEESPNWADRVLHDAIYQLAGRSPSLPNQTGNLINPADILLHPSGLEKNALALWSRYPDRPVNWCHASVETRERRPRAESLLNAAGRTSSSLEEWLEVLPSVDRVAGSQAAIKAACVVVAADSKQSEMIQRAEFVLTQDGSLVAPVPELLFFTGDYLPDGTDISAVSSEILIDPEIRYALELLGIREVDAGLELSARLKRLTASPFDEQDWESFWILTRRLSSESARERILGRHLGKIRVKTLSGQFAPITHCLLPGPIVPSDGSRDESVAIDLVFHGPDRELLEKLGSVSEPIAGKGVFGEFWLMPYKTEAIESFLSGLQGSARPHRNKLGFSSRGTFCGPLVPLTLLSSEGKALFTQAVLAVDGRSPDWTLIHTTRPDAYPELRCLPPSLWAVIKEGMLPTSLGNVAISHCVSPSLSEWREILPVADIPDDVAKRLRMPSSLEELGSETWGRALWSVRQFLDDEAAGRLYATAALVGIQAPRHVRCRVGSSLGVDSPGSITVAYTQDQLAALSTQNTPVVLVASREQAETLISRWGLKSPESSISNEVSYEPVLEAQLVDVFPALRWHLDPRNVDLASVVCESLTLDVLTQTGRTSIEKDFLIEEDAVYWIQSLDDLQVLRHIKAGLQLAVPDEELAQIADHRQDQQRRTKVAAVRRGKDLAEKLQVAIGVPAIRRRLPAGLLDAVQVERGALTERDVANLALAVYGVEVLKNFRTELEEAGFVPPSQWAGGRPTRKFVKDLGFPIEYAGFEHAKRDPLLKVSGPPNLHPLHDFQQVISQQVKDLVLKHDPSRGLLSLPTGAGKTRVAVQSIVELLRDERLAGPILWVAQSDELCEQAVRTWYDVWRSLGARRELFISRLWGPNEAEESDDAPQVVVATIQKLQGCFADDEYGWLKSCSTVLIDEAHGSTEPMYTKLLDWVGLGRGKGETPLIGLTATPFRGTSREETERLVARYGRHRLDAGALGGDPYRELQDRRVLARVQQRLIDGSSISLTPDEMAEMKKMRRLPASAEERLGADTERNRRILEVVRGLPEDWPVLLFATSVAHAQTMAALLRAQGISAAPISGKTDTGARRHYIEEFREGRLRVLTNYSVLTQGFDAPAVRALCVARPTFSPTVYQQMIGRGLRGPLNGGKETCLIINVEDNVAQFGEELAFRQFEYLWDGRQGS